MVCWKKIVVSYIRTAKSIFKEIRNGKENRYNASYNIAPGRVPAYSCTDES